MWYYNISELNNSSVLQMVEQYVGLLGGQEPLHWLRSNKPCLMPLSAGDAPIIPCARGGLLKCAA